MKPLLVNLSPCIGNFTIAAYSCPSAATMRLHVGPMFWISATPLITRLAHFAQSEDGAVAADYIFMTASVTAAGFAVVTTLSQGVEGISGEIMAELSNSDLVFMSQNFGRDRATVLMEGPRAFFSPNAMRTRYNVFSDPGQRNDAQVRNAHRTWARRLDDPAYSQPDRATDMVLILEQSLEVRDLQPHTNI